MQAMDQGITQAYTDHYPRKLLPGFVSSKLQVTKYVNTLSSKRQCKQCSLCLGKD
jgi:hypothetical protein